MTLADLERRAAAGDVEAQRALAQGLDAQGRHTEAIDWWARAGQSGDAQALTVLGIRLTTGHNAPLLPAQGVQLLADAAQAGGAEAAGHLAALAGAGFHMRQSWTGALDLLLRSAELGSVSAQRKLEILSGRGPDSAGEGRWRNLREAVDLAAWTRAPAPAALSVSPRIFSVKALIPPAACAWVIEQSAHRLARAELYDPETGKPVLGTETRLNRIANFAMADTCLLNLMIQARMSAAAGLPFNRSEAFAVLNYAVGEEYGEHVDFLDPAIPSYAQELARMGQRIATCLIYLNEGYEGGETEFPKLGLSFKGGQGDALIFFSADPVSGRPDPRTVHAGRTPTSGQKWLLSQFFRNRPVIGPGPG
jgi:prolyl 4-hydroxylase